jgi:DnaJ-class molecular chaperone
MEDGAKIVFQGAAHEVPTADTGDLVVVLREEPHPVFERKHRDLLIKRDVSLFEALFGTRFVVEHLDGRKVVVTTKRDRVIAPGTVDVIPREGMPSRGDPSERGSLFVQYTVVFPEYESLTPELRVALARIMPPVDEVGDLDLAGEDVAVVAPEDGDLDDFKNAKRERREQRNEAYREDDEGEGDGSGDEEGGGTQASCTPM